MKPRTQRAWAQYDDGVFNDAINGRLYLDDYEPGTQGEVPVLVVPEAAVRQCRHEDCLALTPWSGWCRTCGAFKANTGWQRPRILRVARRKR